MITQPVSKAEAIERFKVLISQYGIKWTKNVPRAAWDELNALNTLLTETDRREAFNALVRRICE